MIKYNGGDLIFDLSAVLKIIGYVAILVGAAWTLQANVSGYTKEVTEQHLKMIKQHDTTIPLLRQICRNTSRTEHAHSQCDKL